MDLRKILNSPKRIFLFIIFLLILGFGGFKVFGNSKNTPQYQTAKAEKGTLVVSISASGQVSSTNGSPVTTQSSGIVNNVYVKNGDQVKAGQVIADINLDQPSIQKQSQAWSNYLQAQNSLSSAQAKINSLQSALFVANQKFMTDRGVLNPSDSQKADPVYIEENANWLQAEADYKNQQAVIAQAQAAVNSSWISYQQTSNQITAPMDGTITDLSINPGTLISGQQTNSSSTGTSSNTNTNSSSQKVATVKAEGNPVISVSLSEVDAPKVKLGQRATVTFDALTDKTFTGKVTGIDTSGSVSSGVTTYPVYIILDSNYEGIYPNMSATANIITNTVDNAILVPLAAVQNQGGQSMVRVIKNGTIQQIPVEIGASSDSQTQVTSGITEGEDVITFIQTQTSSGNTSSSPFGGRAGGFGGGAIMRGAGR